MKFLKKIYVIPALITVILLSMLLIEQINEKTAFPDEGWSRSISFNEISDGRTYFISTNEDETFEAYTPAEDEILHLTVNNNLEVVDRDVIPLKLHKRKDFWANGNDVVYLNENNNVMLFSQGESKEIFKRAKGISFHEKTILIWDQSSVYFVNTQTFKVTKVAEVEKPIRNILIDSDSQSFVAIYDIDPSAMEIAYYVHDYNQYIPVYEGELSLHLGATISDVSFVSLDDNLHFIYTAITRRQGVRKSKTSYLTLNLKSGNIDIQPVQIIDSYNNRLLSNPGDFELFTRDSEVKLLFTAGGFLDKRTVEANIYEAVNVDGEWLAERRSTTYKHSLKPTVVNEHTIIWLDFYPQQTFSEEEYHFHGASSRAEVISMSEALTERDYSISISAMLTALPKSIFILFFAFLWVVPPVLILMTFAFVNPKHIEKTSWKIRITSVVLLTFSQYFVMSTINETVFNIAAPGYLTFPNSMLVYSILLGLISLLIMLFVRTEDWTPSVEFVYISCINAWFISLLYGSYLL